MQTPFFSVIIPTRNRDKYIGDAIQSILNQTFQNFEIIIIDDGDDTTEQIANSFNDNRIRYFHKVTEKRNVSIGRNSGMSFANGQYICFLDSDDYYLKQHLEIHYQNIKNHNFPVSVFSSQNSYERNSIVEKHIRPLFIRNENLNETQNKLLQYVWSDSPPVQTISIHKDIAKVVQFDESMTMNECYDFVGNMVAKYPIYEMDEYSIVMRLHDENDTRYGIDFIYRSLIAFERILQRSIYDCLRSHPLVKNTFRDLSLGLSGCYAKEKNKKDAWKYLKKALGYGFKFSQLRQMIGIIRRLFF